MYMFEYLIVIIENSYLIKICILWVNLFYFNYLLIMIIFMYVFVNSCVVKIICFYVFKKSFCIFDGG